MKNLIKILFIGIVIIGLLASYFNLGSLTTVNQQANVEESFQGPTGEPSTNGPTGVPPTN